jgi:ribosome-associated protein
LIKEEKTIQSNTNTNILHDQIINSILDVKGKNIVKLDLRKLDEAPTDFFIICEGDNFTQVRAIAEKIHEKVFKASGLRPSSKEGTKNGNWVLVDYFTTVIHIFYKDTRQYYNLEDLWADAQFTVIEDELSEHPRH